MKTMLRNLARRWANRMLIRSNDTMRRELIRAQAAAERHEQTADGATKACNDAGRKLLQANAYNSELRDELKHKEDQIERQADMFEQYQARIDEVKRERDTARADRAELARANLLLSARVGELEQTGLRLVAAIGASGVLDAAFDDVVAAGLGAATNPEVRQP